MTDNVKETLLTSALAIPLAASFRNAGIVGMRSGVLTRLAIVKSLFGFEHRKKIIEVPMY